MPQNGKGEAMKSLRWYDYITINLFWLGLNIRNQAVGTIFMPYLVDAFVQPETKNTALGLLRAAGLVIAMVVQPAMGLLSDRSTSRFGRRRPFIAIGVLLDLVFLAAVALSNSYWTLVAAILLLQFSSNISHGALQGLIPDLVPEGQRGRASAMKSVFELLPIILVGITIAKLVGIGEFGWAMVATGGSLLVIMLLTVVLVHEEPLRERPEAPLAGPMWRVLGMLAGIARGAVAGLGGGVLMGGLSGLALWPFAGARMAQIIGLGIGGLGAMAVAVVAGVWGGAMATLGRDASRHSSFTWWVVNRLLFLAAATSLQGAAPYFFMYVFNVSREVAADLTGGLMAVAGIFTLITAFTSGWLADKIGSRGLIGISGMIGTLGTVVLLSTAIVPSLTLIYISGIIIGVATGLFMTANWALGTDLVPPAEAGRYLGISNLAGAGAGMVGAGIGGVLADILNGYQMGLGYFAIFTCYAALFALSAASLLGVRRRAALIFAANVIE